ncbi:MAG: hypothetical protein MJ111_03415 [Clostridia bacterium]|nr:hypothetical protein [Bacteroidaceae bacterium]MCQ2489591.1 hypothetical protein [Clostridia bacterium]
MKKVYIQPSLHRHVLKIEGQILITTPGGHASEEHYGEETSENPSTDYEDTPHIPGTGGDNGFIMGAPTNKRTN